MVIPAMSRLPLPIEYHTTTPSLCDVSLLLRMLAVDVFMCVQMRVDVLLRVVCVCGRESAHHGRVRACEHMSTFYLLLIVLFRILSAVSMSLSVLARCHSLTGKQSRTHTHVNTQTIQNQSTFYY